ncbi:anthranilate synthase component I [Hyphobacterium sp.]|uniref:anthranilate synthase component I n=1 Tax=Hyphobacterium sp. TaxID=2004662 RepID=UPI003749D5C0
MTQTGFAGSSGRLVSVNRVDDLTTPVAAFLKLARDRKNAFLLESVEGGSFRGRFSAIGMDPDLIWTVEKGQPFLQEPESGLAPKPDGRDPVASLRNLISEAQLPELAGIPSIASGLFGYVGYDLIRAIEPLPDTQADDPAGIPEARLIRPRVVIVFDALKQEITAYGRVVAGASENEVRHRLQGLLDQLDAPLPASGTGPEQSIAPVSTFDADAYRASVDRIKQHIKAGDIFQGVLSQRFSSGFDLPAFALYRALRRLNPSPFLFHFQFDGYAVTGSSPEILVRLRDGRVTVRPIAGTRPRGADPAEDAALEADLLADPKERAEHMMLLDLGRNDVGRVAKAGTIRITEREIVERYSHVMHIVSNVEGELADGEDAISALFAGFPAGTVSGAPKVRAMQILDEIEPYRRGYYAGAAGYFSADGNMDMAITLRTALVKDGQMHVQAGAGIVLDSDPEAERQECINKAQALFRAAEQAHRFV